MHIIEAEPQLLKDFIDEIEVTATKENPDFIVHAGRHRILGKVVAIENKHEAGGSLIVEVDE